MKNIMLHQTYKNNLPSKYDKYVHTWTKYNFQRKFYSDSDLIIIIKKYRPEYFNFFKQLKKIEKIDFIRYILMYFEGGIYADMDTILIKYNYINQLLSIKDTIFIGIEYNKLRYQCAQSILISTSPKNIFWKDFTEYIIQHYNSKKYITYNTGPEIFTAFVKKYKDKYNITFIPYLFNNVVKHVKTGSWRIPSYKLLDKSCLLCGQSPFYCHCFNHRWYESEYILYFNLKIIIIILMFILSYWFLYKCLMLLHS